MRATRVAVWILVIGAMAWIAAPMASVAMHGSTAAPTTVGASHFTTMGGNDQQGCGHNDHGDDNNGGGNDEDHDHDCNEEDDDTDG